jgi:hypothetical protein
MNLAEIADFAGLALGFIFTLMIFSYLLGDNPFFRFATHLFIGVASGFALVVVLYNILWLQLAAPIILQPVQSLYLIPPLLLGFWLLITKSTRLARFGNPVMGYLVGAAAAAAIGGAVLGTIFPQISASAANFDLQIARQAGLNEIGFIFSGFIILAGMVTTLAYFHFSARPDKEGRPVRHPLIEELARFGRGFIAITFGVLFAGIYAAALAALINRVNFIVDRIIIENLLPLLQ